jgi:hypothetical protein
MEIYCLPGQLIEKNGKFENSGNFALVFKNGEIPGCFAEM